MDVDVGGSCRCWFTGVGCRVSLSVHGRLLVLVVGRHLLVVDFRCRLLLIFSIVGAQLCVCVCMIIDVLAPGKHTLHVKILYIDFILYFDD